MTNSVKSFAKIKCYDTDVRICIQHGIDMEDMQTTAAVVDSVGLKALVRCPSRYIVLYEWTDRCSQLVSNNDSFHDSMERIEVTEIGR